MAIGGKKTPLEQALGEISITGNEFKYAVMELNDRLNVIAKSGILHSQELLSEAESLLKLLTQFKNQYSSFMASFDTWMKVYLKIQNNQPLKASDHPLKKFKEYYEKLSDLAMLSNAMQGETIRVFQLPQMSPYINNEITQCISGDPLNENMIKRLPLGGITIKPVQRATKYALLFREAMKYSKEGSDPRAKILTQLHEEATRQTTFYNEKQRIHEYNRDIQQHLTDLGSPSLSSKEKTKLLIELSTKVDFLMNLGSFPERFTFLVRASKFSDVLSFDKNLRKLMNKAILGLEGDQNNVEAKEQVLALKNLEHIMHQVYSNEPLTRLHSWDPSVGELAPAIPTWNPTDSSAPVPPARSPAPWRSGTAPISTRKSLLIRGATPPPRPSRRSPKASMPLTVTQHADRPLPLTPTAAQQKSSTPPVRPPRRAAPRKPGTGGGSSPHP